MQMNLDQAKRQVGRSLPFLKRPYRWLRESSRVLRYGFADISRVGLIGESVGQEACSICQLKCPLCPTAKGTNDDAIGRGYLRLEHFKKFVRENPEVKHLELANWGEIFLNPQIKEIIQFAYENHVRLTASSGVNLNNVKDDVLESLVTCRFRLLSVSIDGGSNDTYKLYRVRGNFDNVIRNIEKIVFYKKKYHSEFPLLRWQFIVMGHNEHELPMARKKAAELGMTFAPKLNVDSSYAPIKNPEFVRKETGLGAASREEFVSKKRQPYTWSCYQLWHLPRINWDGKLLGCCTNIWGDFGNVFESGFKETIQGEKLTYAKRMLLGEEKPRDDIPCTHCYLFKSIQKDPLKKIDIIRGKKYTTSANAPAGDWASS